MFTVKTKAKLVVARLKVVVSKLVLVSLGLVIGSSGMFVSIEGKKLFEPQIMTFEQPLRIETVQAKEIEPVEEWKIAEFSAYTASVGETDSNPLVMASGKIVYLGAAACPRDMKFGTVIELKNGKQYTCEDRMNARYTNNFDIFMIDKSDALAFGRKALEYKIVK